MAAFSEFQPTNTTPGTTDTTTVTAASGDTKCVVRLPAAGAKITVTVTPTNGTQAYPILDRSGTTFEFSVNVGDVVTLVDNDAPASADYYLFLETI